MKKRITKYIGVFMSVVLLAGSINMQSVQAEESNRGITEMQTVSGDLAVNENIIANEVSGQVSGNQITETQSDTWDGKTTEAIYDGEGYQIIFSLADYWEGAYKAEITIKNIKDTNIENWCIRFPFRDSISDIWNAEICNNADGACTIKNVGWNQQILAGESISFGFMVSDTFKGFPDKYELLGTSTEVVKEDYTIAYQLNNDWGSGFVGSISITNHTNESLESWRLEFDFDRVIHKIWNGTIVSCEDSHYVIQNSVYNNRIEAGETITIGFTGKEGSSIDEPVNYALYTYETDTCNSMEKDTDKDGLVDAIEIALGFNYQVSDSDGDGLTDYEEYHITITNPLKKDTDENGMEDGEDDIDGEGLSNSEELKIGTNPLQADTDNDNLTDYEEIYVHGTNPMLADTDEDGLIDYDDVILGFSPLLKDTDNNGIIDSEEKIDQTVTRQFKDVNDGAVIGVNVSLSTNGNAQESVIIENVYGVDQLSSNVVGLIGIPVDINCKAAFEQAEMVFYYDESMLGDTKEENLAILWYDEENNWYQILDEDSVIDTENNTVTYVTTHFSTYMLVDKEEWYNAWRENIDYRNSTSDDTTKNYFDIAFVVDVSGSMKGSRINSAQTAINNFVNAMQYEDEAAIIKFNSYAYSVCDFSSDKDILKKGVNSLRASGGTNVNRGLLKAIEVFDSHKCKKQKILILLCDGDVNYVQSTIDMCISGNIQIYAVNVASSTAHASLEKMAFLTKGQYYYGYSADMLETIFATIENDTLEQIDTTDTDGDGLYDIYENAGMKLPNGQIIYTDPARRDTDEDNLTDLQETGLVYNIDDRYIGKGEYANIKYFQLRSDPTKEDSDADGIMDAEDKKPFEQDIVLVAQLDSRYPGFEYLNIKVSEGKTVSGGDQTWWLEKSQHKSDEGGIDCVTKIMEDKNYRLKKYGCGVIAMCDMELYLKQQNEDNSYGIPSLLMPFEGSTGICPKDEYMNYVDYLYDTRYTIGDDVVNNVFKGIKSWTMEIGMNDFLRKEVDDSSYALWGIYRHLPFKLQKESVLCNIEKMLKDNIPVVFSYCSFGDEEDKLTLYPNEVSVKEKRMSDENERVKQHYMTVIGLSKYYEEETQNPKYLLKVVSWGNIYYIDYDEYADKLSYFSNILSVH